MITEGHPGAQVTVSMAFSSHLVLPSQPAASTPILEVRLLEIQKRIQGHTAESDCMA